MNAPTPPAYTQVDRCGLCSGIDLARTFTIRYLAEDSRGFLAPAERADGVDFHLVRCRQCGFTLTTPRASTSHLRELYERTGEDYFAPLAEPSSERITTYRRASRLALDAGITQGRVLDLGCGTGQALAQWPPSFTRHGVEPSEFAAHRAEAEMQAQVHVGDLESARFPSGHFDVVTAFDVVEHLEDPLGAFREVARILRPGGLFIIETGDIGSINARLAGGHWYYVRLPGHISFFSRRTMARALGNVGFVRVRLFRLHHGSFDAQAVLGHLRAMTRHLLIRGFGPSVLALPVFRSRNLDYSVRYFCDHMLAVAARKAVRPAEEQENR